MISPRLSPVAAEQHGHRDARIDLLSRIHQAMILVEVVELRAPLVSLATKDQVKEAAAKAAKKAKRNGPK